jgi:hypothetical protein
MALTTEQQAQVDISNAIEATRNANNIAMESRRAKLEAIRLAKEVLIENHVNLNTLIDTNLFARFFNEE